MNRLALRCPNCDLSWGAATVRWIRCHGGHKFHLLSWSNDGPLIGREIHQAD